MGALIWFGTRGRMFESSLPNQWFLITYSAFGDHSKFSMQMNLSRSKPPQSTKQESTNSYAAPQFFLLHWPAPKLSTAKRLSFGFWVKKAGRADHRIGADFPILWELLSLIGSKRLMWGNKTNIAPSGLMERSNWKVRNAGGQRGSRSRNMNPHGPKVQLKSTLK